MSAIKCVAFFLAALVFRTAVALECHECSGPEQCNDPELENVVQCNDANSQAVQDELSRLFYPSLPEVALRNGRYQCTSHNLTRWGESAPSTRIMGCMFETSKSVCHLDTPYLPNFAILGCRACDWNRCTGNGSAALGWSILLVIASVMASSIVVK
nr:uncharacterized protein LOC109423648 [Aedes albopictus]